MPIRSISIQRTKPTFFALALLWVVGCASDPPKPKKIVRTIPADFRVADAVVLSGRSREKVMAAVEKRREDIMGCYLSTLADDPGTKGTIVFRIVIHPSGQIEKLAFEPSTVKNEFLKNCVAKQLRAMKFSELIPPAVTEVPTLKLEFNPPVKQTHYETEQDRSGM